MCRMSPFERLGRTCPTLVFFGSFSRVCTLLLFGLGFLSFGIHSYFGPFILFGIILYPIIYPHSLIRIDWLDGEVDLLYVAELRRLHLVGDRNFMLLPSINVVE